MAKKALIAGATGLVGSHLLTKLLESKEYSEVTAFSRRELEINHKKLKVIITNLENVPQVKADDVFCCLGTTIKKAGSKEVFKKVDYDYVLALAHMAHKKNARHFLVISSMGAHSQSKMFYCKVKGMMEEDVSQCGLQGVTIFRPSLILGTRKEFRLAERIGVICAQIFNWFIPRKYKAIEAREIACAMLHAAQEVHEGVRIIPNGLMVSKQC